MKYIEPSPLTSALLTSVEPITPSEASTVAADHFNISGTAKALGGECDCNFLIQTPADAFVIKFASPAQDRALTDLQTGAFLHVALRDPLTAMPRVVLARDGGTSAELRLQDSTTRIVRVLTYIPGLVGARARPSASLRRSLGATAARLDLALADYRHPMAGHILSWDLQHAAELRPLLPAIQSDLTRDHVQCALDRFEDEVLLEAPGLRRQFIHNDLNPYNYLVSQRDPCEVVGVIDFGDIVHAPLINEVAIAIAHNISAEADPIEQAGEILAAYNAIIALRPSEIDLLYDVIRTRLAVTVLISEWRAQRDPANAAYILKNHNSAETNLDRLSQVSRVEAGARFRAACETELAP